MPFSFCPILKKIPHDMVKFLKGPVEPDLLEKSIVDYILHECLESGG